MQKAIISYCCSDHQYTFLHAYLESKQFACPTWFDICLELISGYHYELFTDCIPWKKPVIPLTSTHVSCYQLLLTHWCYTERKSLCIYRFPNEKLDTENDCRGIVDKPIFVEYTVYPKKYAHGFVVLCFVVVMQSIIMNSREVFIHIHQGCFAGTGAIVRLPQCQWSKPDGYGKISQCITTTKHSKAKTVCIFLGIYCSMHFW